MKKHILPLTFCLLFVAACHFTGSHDDRQPQTKFVPDSLWTPTGNAQLDSLLQLAAVAPQDTNLAYLYSEIGDMYMNSDFEKAKEYYQKSGNMSEQLNWNKGRYMYAADFASILHRNLLTDSAVVILKKAVALAEREKDESWKAILNYNIGNTYNEIRWYETALNYYMEALPFFEMENHPRKLTALFYMVSQLYGQIRDVEKAVEYGEKALALYREDPYVYYALAVAYATAQQFEKAKGYFEESLRLCELKNNIFLKGGIYGGLAVVAMSAFDLEKAEKYIIQSLEINRQSGNYHVDLLTFSRIELLKGNYGQSEAYAKEALQIATEIEDLDVKRDCYMILSELACAQRKYRENLMYWLELDLVENEQTKTTALRASEEMHAKYETAKKELEIERQKNIISKHIMQRSLLAGVIAVTAVVLSLLWYMLRLRTRRNRALAEMNATKDKFFSIISHDLKNPAVAQRDAIQLLVRNDRLWDADTLTDYYAGLLKSADGQVELLYNLLNWAKIQTGRMTYTPASFGLVSQLRADLALIRNMAENKGITLDIGIPDDTLVTGDSNMLVTVIRNLLTNAVKFTASGGTVRLLVEPAGNGKYAFTVSDTGTGMSKEQIHNLFRIDSAHFGRGTAGEQGSGLGLIVCRELLEKHSSKLHVESEEGKGSKFWFEV